MLAARERQNVFLFQAAVSLVIVGRHRFFQPRHAVSGHLPCEALDGGEVIAAIAHAPPSVRVYHEIEIRADGLAHETHGFEILVRAERGTHFVGAKSQIRDGGGFFGVLLGRHVHAGAAIQTDAVAHAATDSFGKWHAHGFGHQVIQRDFHRAINFREIRILAGAIEKLDAQGIGIGEGTAREKWRDGVLDDCVRTLTARAGCITCETVIGVDADQHGVAFQDRALSAVEGKLQRLTERVRE